MSETLNLNPEESLPEQNFPEASGPMDENNMEDEIRETRERMQKKEEAPESESVLDKEPEKGETMDVAAEKTRIEKSGEDKDKQAAEIKKELEEELRKNPVRLTDEESSRVFQEAEKREAEKILSELTDKGKDMYPDRSAVIEARERMLQNMVDNKVIPESEKQSFCSEGAFYELLGKGYDAENIRLAGPWDTIKKAFFGVPIIQQIKVLREIATKGELLVMPSINGRKDIISFEDFRKEAGALDLDFELKIEGARRLGLERLRILAEREDEEIQKRLIERLEEKEKIEEVAKRLEVDEKSTEQAKKEMAGKEEGKNPVINSKSSEKSKEPEIEESISREDIEKVSSFEELDALLAKSGSIIGSRGKSYDTEKLRSLIKKHIIGVEELIKAKVSEKEIKKHITDEANFLFKNITRSAGLRDKVIELLLSMSGHPEESTERKKKKRKEKNTKNKK